MYVYQRCAGEPFYVVGFYDPQGKWITESDQDTREQAAARVAWLTGAGTPRSRRDRQQRPMAQNGKEGA